ncbi:MAG TPA: DUF922 domain-containing protein [Allosphingosinicella sp.]|nr:DUF922 domain-containing protein [Allosphingosinicella sp.]
MNRLLKIVLGGAALLLTPLGVGLAALQTPAASASQPVPFAGIPGVERLSYDVSGASVAAIRRSIDNHPERPRDPNDGLRVDALANWYMRWSWPAGPSGGCDLARARIQFSARVTMPRLLNERLVPAPVLARWRAYLDALERHEDGHVRYAFDHMGEVLAAIRASSCARANDDARAVIQRIGRHDIDYDRETDHGTLQGARFP